MHVHPSKYPSKPDTSQQRGYSRMNQSHTPSKRDKYDSYTPRKRYIKEQEQYDWYRNLQIQQVDSFPEQFSSQIEPAKPFNHKIRNNSSHKKQPITYQHSPNYQFNDIHPSSYEKIQPSDTQIPLRQMNVQHNCPTSVRKTKLKNYLENKEICKKITFAQSQNSDNSNTVFANAKKDYRENKQRYLDIQNHFCLTPRRSMRNDQHATAVNSKLTVIQNKIARLQRMTPKKSTPKQTQPQPQPQPQPQHQPQPQYSNCSQTEREQSKIQSSRISISSSKQNEIMSRVSLGRLVQQQQCQTQMQVIQDLSYKISSKLRSIIRNFG